jgi:hypothetical protein
VNIVEALDHPHLFEPWFSGPSWDAWRAILKAAFALPMTAAELATFRTLAERDPPDAPVRELWIIAGRRSGKDSIASLSAAYVAAFVDYRSVLRPGERALVMCLAVDRDQAGIVAKYTKGYFDEIPLLKGMLVGPGTDQDFELSTRAEVAIHTNSFRAVRGRSIAACVMDECGYWRSADSANPDVEVYNAVSPGLSAPLKGLLVGISSPYRRAGLLFEKWKAHYGKPGDVLVIKAPSIALNPTLDPAIIERALAADPEAAAAEWLGEWRSDLADFVSRQVVEAAVEAGIYERPRLPGIVYSAFCDPSGGSSDSMTLAIGHADGDSGGVQDLVREIRAPFSPSDAVREFAGVLEAYGINRITGDRYAGMWPREAFFEYGITYEPSEKSKSDLYIEFLPLLNSRRASLLDNSRLVGQLCSLERRTGRGTGRDSIDHPSGAHDDVANSVAGVLVAVAGGGVNLVMWTKLGAEDASAVTVPRVETLARRAAVGEAASTGLTGPVVGCDRLVVLGEELAATKRAKGGRPTQTSAITAPVSAAPSLAQIGLPGDAGKKRAARQWDPAPAAAGSVVRFIGRPAAILGGS